MKDLWTMEAGYTKLTLYAIVYLSQSMKCS